MIKRLILLSVLVFTPLLASPAGVLAVDPFNQEVCERDAASSSTVCKDKELKGENPLFGKNGILTIVIRLLSAIVAIAAIIMIIIAGFKFVTSGSNPQE